MNQYNDSKKINIDIEILLFLMIFISPIVVLQIGRKELFLWLQIIFVCLLTIRKFSLVNSKILLFIFLEPFISAFFAVTSTMPEKYKSTAINLAIMSIPLYLVISYLSGLIKAGYEILDIIIRAFKLAIIIEIVWIPLQLVFYRLIGIDINKIIFVDTLHMVSNASFVRSWVWYPSGLSWHSAVLAPLFAFGILIWDNSLIRIIILAESFICGNNTTLIGVVCVFMFLCLRSFYRKHIIVTDQIIVLIVLVVAACAIVVLSSGIREKFSDVVVKLLGRFFSAEKDASTVAHFGYYSDCFKILKNCSISQLIFGYGVGCSGYTITELYGRYADGGTWAIESDFVNILVSRGLVGFIAYYGFLIYIMIRGRKIDSRYFILMGVILIQGFGYNIQFDYILLLEAILFITIDNDINFFESVDKINNKNIGRG